MEPPTSGRRLHANSTPCELMSSVKPSGLTCLEPACVIDNGSRILKRVPFRWSPERPRMLSSMVAQPAYNPGGPSVTAGKTNHLCLLPVGPSCTLSWPPDEPRAEGDRMRSQMVADGRLRCDSLLLCALFSIIYLVVISWAFVAGHFAAQPQGNETNGFFPLEPFLPFP